MTTTPTRDSLNVVNEGAESADSNNEIRSRLLPRNDRARRAIKALDENRLDDAANHIAVLSEDSALDCAWKYYLSARLAWAQHDLSAAELHLARAIEATESIHHSSPSDQESYRLAAMSHDLLGNVCRRQDRLEKALEHHSAALRLREHYGSQVELWESAGNLGMDAHIARRYDNAIKWHTMAATYADRVEVGKHRRLAISQSNLANSLSESGQLDVAVDAARKARDLWYRHDPTASTATIADVRLAESLQRLAESELETNSVTAITHLNEAIILFEAAHVSFCASGSTFQTEAQTVGARLDFVRRLLASIQAET